MLVLYAHSGASEPTKGAISDLISATQRLATTLDGAGRHVDAALLTIAGARRQVTRYLRHLARAGLAALDGGQYTITPGALPDRADAPADIPGVPPDGAGYNLYPLRYAWNEAYEMLAAAGMLPAVASPPVYSAGAGAATDRAAAERMG